MPSFPSLEWFEQARTRCNDDPRFRKLGTADARFAVRQGDAIVEVQFDAFEIGKVVACAPEDVPELDFCIAMDAPAWQSYLEDLRSASTRRSISDLDLLATGGVVSSTHARGRLNLMRYLRSIDLFFEHGARV